MSISPVPPGGIPPEMPLLSPSTQIDKTLLKNEEKKTSAKEQEKNGKEQGEDSQTLTSGSVFDKSIEDTRALMRQKNVVQQIIQTEQPKANELKEIEIDPSQKRKDPPSPPQSSILALTHLSRPPKKQPPLPNTQATLTLDPQLHPPKPIPKHVPLPPPVLPISKPPLFPFPPPSFAGTKTMGVYFPNLMGLPSTATHLGGHLNKDVPSPGLNIPMQITSSALSKPTGVPSEEIKLDHPTGEGWSRILNTGESRIKDKTGEARDLRALEPIHALELHLASKISIFTKVCQEFTKPEKVKGFTGVRANSQLKALHYFFPASCEAHSIGGTNVELAHISIFPRINVKRGPNAYNEFIDPDVYYLLNAVDVAPSVINRIGDEIEHQGREIAYKELDQILNRKKSPEEATKVVAQHIEKVMKKIAEGNFSSPNWKLSQQKMQATELAKAWLAKRVQ